MRQRKSKLMREHTNLSAMVSLMSNHVTQHLHANRPGLCPTISSKAIDTPTTPECLTKHLLTPNRALRQSRTRLILRTVRAIQQRRNLQVRSRKPHPLAANIVHMRKDRRNAPNLTGRLRPPRARVKMLDKTLVHSIISSKHLNRSPIKLSVNLLLAHGSASPSNQQNSHRIPNQPPVACHQRHPLH
jgi:hypothetical protein